MSQVMTLPASEPTPVVYDESNIWYVMFTLGHPDLRELQRSLRELPCDPRCRLCYAPFGGEGGEMMRREGRGPSSRNPYYCNLCDIFIRNNPGGAEVEMTMLFVDVRDSTALAERIRPAEYSRLMNQFYAVAIDIVNRTDGFIDKLVGDEVIGLYPPGFSGADHAGQAVKAARELLALPPLIASDGTVLRMGVGVHTGVVYVGTVSGADGAYNDITVLGDSVNTAARLASHAGAGEALVSDAARHACSSLACGAEWRELTVKGKTFPVGVSVLRS